MRLTVIGCSGSLAGPDSPASSYLVQADGFSLVLDLGNGALGALQRHLALTDLDAVILSHLHPDHYIDMCGLHVARAYDPRGGYRELPVYGPSGTAKRLDHAYDGEIGDRFDIRALTAGLTFDIGPFAVTVDRVDHPVEAYGIRLEHGGRTLTYSGDTDTCSQITGLARNADLFLCEAAFQEGRDTDRHVHLTGRRAGQVAAAAAARRLVLTHIPPWTDADVVSAEAREVFDGPLEVATPGATYDI